MHIDISKHLVHEATQNRHQRLIKVGTTKQLADLFTKALPHAQSVMCVQGILNNRVRVNATRTVRATVLTFAGGI